MLKKNLTETETLLKTEQARITSLTKQLKQYDDVPTGNNFCSISNVASAKIVELSKKVREKSSELESMKSKYSKLEHQLLLFQQKEEEKCAKVEKGVFLLCLYSEVTILSFRAIFCNDKESQSGRRYQTIK